MSSLALEGIRVIDLTYVHAGPFMARQLADFGAEVIKVESIQRPELIRPIVLAENEPGGQYWNRGGYFNLDHRNKYAITLNLNHERGRELLKELIKVSDVLLEAYAPRVMKNFGLEYDVLKEIKPDLIMMSLSGYGQTGPRRHFKSLGTVIEATSGITQLTGYLDGPPLKTGISFGDPITGILGAGMVLAALCKRKETGVGTHIDLSMNEVGTSFVGETIMDYGMNGRIQERMENRHNLMAPHGCYRCKGEDAWITIAVGSEDEWVAFCKAMDDPAWTQDKKFSDPLKRLRNQDELDGHIERWTSRHGHTEAMKILQEAGVAAGAVLNNKELLFDPHLKERGFVEVIDHPSVGKRPHAGMMFKLSKTPGNVRMAAPSLGKHNQRVLKDILGLDDEELQQLEDEEVIGTVPATAQVMGTEMTPEELLELLSLPHEQMLEVGGIVRMEKDYREQLGLVEKTQTDKK